MTIRNTAQQVPDLTNGVDVGQLLRLAIDTGHEQRHEVNVGDVVGQIVVQESEGLFDRRLRSQQGVQLRANLRHDQRGAQPMAAHVADNDSQSPVLKGQIIAVVSSRKFRRIRLSKALGL